MAIILVPFSHILGSFLPMPGVLSSFLIARTARSLLGLAGVSFFTWVMLRIIWPYTSGRSDIDFLLSKQHIIHLLHYRAAFYLHIFPALLVLAAGLTQFSGSLLRRVPALHRWMGRMYAFSILLVCGPAGMVMAWYANGGPFAQASFLSLSILWWGSTWWAWRAIRAGNIRAHGAWMIRSYALTFSAITLRLMQYGLAMYADLDPETAYRLVAWPSWLLNLLVAEILLARTAWLAAMLKK